MKKMFLVGILSILSLEVFSLPAPISDESLSWALHVLAQKGPQKIAEESVMRCYLEASNEEQFREFIETRAANFDRMNNDDPSILQNQSIEVHRSGQPIMEDLNDIFNRESLKLISSKKYYDGTDSEDSIQSCQYSFLPCGKALPWDILAGDRELTTGDITIKDLDKKFSGFFIGSINPRFAFDASRCFHPQSTSNELFGGIRFIQLVKCNYRQVKAFDYQVIQQWDSLRDINAVYFFPYKNTNANIHHPEQFVGTPVILTVACTGECKYPTFIDLKKYEALYRSFGGSYLEFLADCCAMETESDSDEN